MSVPTLVFGDRTSFDGEWQSDAQCHDIDVEVFFSLDEQDQRQALETCKACPVQQECLRYAIDSREMYGIWGGMTESERRGIIRENRRVDRERRKARKAAAEVAAA